MGKIQITAGSLSRQYLKDLLNYKELLYFFAWRDLLVRYRHTALGLIWIIVRPVINMLVFAFVFGKIAKMESDVANYPLFVLIALIPWQLFTSSLVDATSCLSQNSNIITKVYFPRIILPISQVIVNFVDFSVGFLFIFIISLSLGALSSAKIIFIPIMVLLTVSLSLAAAIWISAINIRFRDFKILTPFILQFGLFISPIGYSSALVPERYQYLYYLNPMVGIVEGFRWTMYGVSHPNILTTFFFSVAVTFFLLITGIKYFRNMERSVADTI